MFEFDYLWNYFQCFVRKRWKLFHFHNIYRPYSSLQEKKNLFSSKFNFFEFLQILKIPEAAKDNSSRWFFFDNTFDNAPRSFLPPLSYVTYAHTADHNSFTRDVEKDGKRIHRVLAFEENFALPFSLSLSLSHLPSLCLAALVGHFPWVEEREEGGRGTKKRSTLMENVRTWPGK